MQQAVDLALDGWTLIVTKKQCFDRRRTIELLISFPSQKADRRTSAKTTVSATLQIFQESNGLNGHN